MVDVEVPTVLRKELYAIPALGGAIVCLVVRLIGLRYRVDVPIAPSEPRRNDRHD